MALENGRDEEGQLEDYLAAESSGISALENDEVAKHHYVAAGIAENVLVHQYGRNNIVHVFSRSVEAGTEKGLDSSTGKGFPFAARLIVPSNQLVTDFQSVQQRMNKWCRNGAGRCI
ncbi:conserved hypothetical protein [Ricinus communis]|uniref:Uncharacterized protein n=1 Tax=Ricinus communis TaxID=3988 RepID=B9S9M1_RICCO|nr:conserved hypothetical protein [Ricinus communis]